MLRDSIEQIIETHVAKAHKETTASKNISGNIIATYTIAAQNAVTEQTQSPNNNNSKRDVKLSWIYFLLGLLCQLLFWSIIIIDISGNPLFNSAPRYLLIFLRYWSLPIALGFFIVSLVYSFKSMKGGHNAKLIPIVIVDIAGIIIAGFLAIVLL